MQPGQATALAKDDSVTHPWSLSAASPQNGKSVANSAYKHIVDLSGASAYS
jgi:hypothetical protein